MSTVKASTPKAILDTPERVFGIFTRSGLLLTGLVGLSFVILFYRWFFQQGTISLRFPEDWGHAFVIPLISGYMVYMLREKINRTSVVVFWPAFVPFVLGIQAYAYTMFNIQNHMLQGMSLILTLGSVVLWMVGPAMFRYLFLPIAYLVLMMTISEGIMLAVTFKLQLIASQGSWLMLNLIGNPLGWFEVDIDGNTLMMTTASGEVFPMNVAEACSGMRMVVAFYALAVAVALMGSTQWWQRIALVLLAGPVAVFMNMIRVTVLGLLMMVNPSLAEGDAHTIIGTLLLIPSLMLFLGIAWMLNRLISPSDEELGNDDADSSPAQAGTP